MNTRHHLKHLFFDFTQRIIRNEKNLLKKTFKTDFKKMNKLIRRARECLEVGSQKTKWKFEYKIEKYFFLLE